MKRKADAFFRKYPTLSTLATAAVFIVVQALFSFCSKVHCPAFSDALYDSWLPYHQNQLLVFADSSGQTDSITISQADQSEAYTTSAGFGGQRCDISARLQSTPGTYRYYELTVEETVFNDTTKTGSLAFGDLDVPMTGIADTGLQVAKWTGDLPVSTHFHSSYDLGGKTYSRVQEITRTDIASAKAAVHKLWLAENFGLIGYEETDGTIWTINH